MLNYECHYSLELALLANFIIKYNLFVRVKVFYARTTCGLRNVYLLYFSPVSSIFHSLVVERVILKKGHLSKSFLVKATPQANQSAKSSASLSDSIASLFKVVRRLATNCTPTLFGQNTVCSGSLTNKTQYSAIFG